MKEEFRNFLKITKNIETRIYKKGVLFFDRKAIGSMGYLLQGGKVLKIPITLGILAEKDLPSLIK